MEANLQNSGIRSCTKMLPGRICEKTQIMSVLTFIKTELSEFSKIVMLDNQLVVTYPARYANP